MNGKIIAGYNADNLLTNIIYEGNYIKFNGTTSAELEQELKEKDKEYPGLYNTYYKAMLDLYNAKRLWKNGNKEEALKLKAEVDNVYESKDMTDLYLAAKDIENLKLHNNEEVAKAKKDKKFSLKKKIVAGTLIAAMTIGTVACALNKDKTDKNQPVIEETQEQDLSELSLEELMEMLHKGAQYDAFKEMSDVQDYFNNTAAPTIKTEADKGGQLFLTATEVITMYKYANSFTKSPEEFFEIFGNSAFPDELNTASEVMVAYYLRATEKSGVAGMFGESAESFEEAYLTWNANKTKANRTALRNKLFNHFERATVDNLKDTDPESATYILTFMLPTLLQNNIISNSEFKDLVNQNKSVTCNEIINTQLKAVADYALQRVAADVNNELDNIDVVKEMPRAMDDANIKVKDRNRVVVGAGIEYRTEQQIKDMTAGSEGYNKTYSKPVKKSRKVTKKEAIKEFGKDKVEEAEKKADKEFEDKYDDINAKEEAYAKGLKDGFNLIEPLVKYQVYAGKTPSYSDFKNEIAALKAKYSGKYSSKYYKGVDEGAKKAYNIALKEAKEELEDYNKKHPVVDDTNNNNNSNNNNNNQSGGNSSTTPNGDSSSGNNSNNNTQITEPEDDYVAPPKDEEYEEYIPQDQLEKSVSAASINEESIEEENVKTR